MKNVGVFLRGDYRTDPLVGSVFSGLSVNRFNPVQFSVSAWGEKQFDDFEFVIVAAMGGRHGAIAKYYQNIGIPALIMEVSYTTRLPDSHPECKKLLTWNSLNNIPIWNAPRERQLLPVQPRKSGPGPVVICSQKFGDAVHNMDERAVRKWTQKAFESVIRLTKRKIIHRPHPASMFYQEGTTPENPLEVSIEDSLHQADILVTHSSTTGLTALAEGLLVFCDPSAHYAHLCQTELVPFKNAKRASVEEVEDYFRILGYHEWSLGEIASGEAFRMLLNFKAGVFPTIPKEVAPETEASSSMEAQDGFNS